MEFAAPGFPVIADADRVRRLLALPDVRPKALERLRQATVVLVGMGGLGTASAPYLAAAGVGKLVLIDPETVSGTDLGRQILYGPMDVGHPKVEVAARALSRQNPGLAIEVHQQALDATHIEVLLGQASIVLDGLDVGPPRDLLNQFAVSQGVPVVFAGALGYEGQVMLVPGGGRPCLACLFGSVSDAPGECSREGVLGPLVGMVGAVEAQEALKWVMRTGTPLAGRLWSYDAFTGATRIVTIPANPTCPVCGGGPVETA